MRDEAGSPGSPLTHALGGGTMRAREEAPLTSSEFAEALAHERGTLLVTGGPGSGKTTLLCERYARLVESGVDAERIALFVLDRRAARRLRVRIVRRLARSLPSVNVFTVHQFAYAVMGRRFADLGYREPPTVLSAAEQEAEVRELLANEDERLWPESAPLLRVPGFVKQVAAFVLRAQERLLQPEEMHELAAGRGRLAEAAGFYERYLDVLGAADRIDFAALLVQTAAILQRGLSVDERFAHLLADDYHDVSPVLETILGSLAPAADSTVVAADPDGAVARFRGSSGGALDRFPRERVVALPPGERIDPALLRALDDPVPRVAESTGNLEARLYAHPGEEADGIAHEIVRLHVEDEVPWGEIAVVLRRYGSMVAPLRQAFTRHGVPAVVAGGEAGLAREPAVAPILDLLRFVASPERRPEMLERVLTSRVGGFTPQQVRALRRRARAGGADILTLALDSEHPVSEITRRLEPVIGSQRADETLWIVLRMLEPVRRAVHEQDHRSLDALSSLSEVVSRFSERREHATIVDLLDAIEAASFTPEPRTPPEERYPDAVRILSAHHAQGCEFEVVFVAGCVEGEFPAREGPRRLVDFDELLTPRPVAERERDRLAEERRLFRLAVSRARRRTILTAARSAGATNPRTPSRYVHQRLGLEWIRPSSASRPTSLRSLQARLRAVALGSREAGPEELAAIVALRESGDDPAAWWGVREWTQPSEPLYPAGMSTSYTRMSNMRNCGLQYLYQVEMGLNPTQSFQMWVGSVVHQILDEAQRGVIEKTADALLARLDEMWDAAQFPNRAIEHRKRLDCEQMLRNWIAAESGSEVVSSEQAFEYTLDETTVRGKIDAIFRMNNGKLRIVDYKTGRTMPTREEVKSDLQLASYYLATTLVPELEAFGPVGCLQLAYIAKPSRESPITLLGATPADVADWAEQEVRSLIARIRAEAYAPSPDADCQWCDFKPICPMFPQGRDAAP